MVSRPPWTSALAALAVLAAAGCEPTDEGFKLHLGWRETGSQACPAVAPGVTSCRAIPIACGVRVLVRIVDATTGEPYYEECLPLAHATDACALASLPITETAIPPGDVRVQLTVWTDAELTRLGLAPDACPSSRFVDGLPVAPSPGEAAPMLGGEAPYTIGDGTLAHVELGCPAWGGLDELACRADHVTLDARVRDLATQTALPPASSADLQLRIGVPRDTGSGHALDLDAPASVVPLSESDRHWQVVIPRERAACLRIAGRGEIPTVHCLDTSAATWPLAPVALFVISPPLLADALARVGFDHIPAAGLVIGIVLDDTGAPVPGAEVITSDGGITYLDKDPNARRTGPNGLFVATATPFGAPWRATAPGGLADDGLGVGGLVAGHISVVVLRMNRHDVLR